MDDIYNVKIYDLFVFDGWGWVITKKKKKMGLFSREVPVEV